MAEVIKMHGLVWNRLQEAEIALEGAFDLCEEGDEEYKEIKELYERTKKLVEENNK